MYKLKIENPKQNRGNKKIMAKKKSCSIMNYVRITLNSND